MEFGIFGSLQDDQVRILKKRLEDKNCKVTVIDFKEFPSKVRIYFNEEKIIFEGKNLFDMNGFYVRQLGYFWPVPHIKLTKEQWMKYYERYNDLLLNERENLSFKHSMIRILNYEKLVVNPYDSFMYHRMKPYQYYLFHKHNLPIPPFFAGDAHHITEKCNVANMVYKPLAGGAEVIMANDFLKKNKEIIEKRAVLFQEYIKGENIRVFLAEDEFIGAGKILQGPQVDSRAEQYGVEVVDLPEDIKEIAFKALEIVGMKFSGVDFMLSKDGEYYLLECNPSPMFYVFEQWSGIKVSEKLAEYLIRHGKQ
ncbi:MAG: hypothetical protein DRN11_02585 [Thermoplasmata archaeon]|nr:MAG: hypothetical protein DRN11_02585 [Thermoplasmata archaeon]